MKNRDLQFVGVIPSRFASTRFPGKPLADLHGKPLLQWVIEGACQSQMLTKILIATDDERIAAVVRSMMKQSGIDSRIDCVMTDSDLPSGTDRVHAAISSINCDVVINIQGDEPLVDGSLIDSLARLFLTGRNIDMATLAHPIFSLDELQSPHAVKVIVNQDMDAIYFSRFPIPYSRSTAKEGEMLSACMKHIGMYAYRQEFLKKFCSAPPALIELSESLEQLRALFLGAKIRVLPVDQATPGVDTPEDLERVKTLILKNKGQNKK